jgi:hypothetical protein
VTAGGWIVPTTVSISDDSTYLLATITGTFSLSLARELLENVARMHVATGATKVLIDARQQAAPLDMIEAYEIGNALTQKPLRAITFAVVIPVPLTEYHFLETVAVNRGVNVRYFDDYDGALAWLSCQPPQPSLS